MNLRSLRIQARSLSNALASLPLWLLGLLLLAAALLSLWLRFPPPYRYQPMPPPWQQPDTDLVVSHEVRFVPFPLTPLPPPFPTGA